MKQYLTRAQMRDLNVLGIDTRRLATHECTENGITYFSFSIGDLIGMLPPILETHDGQPIEITHYDGLWTCYMLDIVERASELIDALFGMVVKLKKEGLI